MTLYLYVCCSLSLEYTVLDCKRITPASSSFLQATTFDKVIFFTSTITFRLPLLYFHLGVFTSLYCSNFIAVLELSGHIMILSEYRLKGQMDASPV